MPIIKLRDKKSGIFADITINRPECYKSVLTVLACQAQYPELRPLYFVLKCFLRERGSLDKTKKGGVCSFMLINMIVAYLQTAYKEASHKAKFAGEPSDIYLHRHLLHFFRHYGLRLNQRESGVSIRAGGFLFGKTEDDLMSGRSGQTRLCIESPVDRLEDIGQGAYNYSLVKKHFKLAHDMLYSYAQYSKSFLAIILSDKLLLYYSQINE